MTPPRLRARPAAPAADPFLVVAMRLAAQMVSRPDAVPRRASFLQLRGELLTPVAEYDDSGEVLRGAYRLADFPDVARAMATGDAQVIEWAGRESVSPQSDALITKLQIKSSALVPVVSGDSVVGVIAVSARDDHGFDDWQLEQLVAFAQLVTLGVTHVATDEALRDEAELSHGLERLKGEFLNIAAHELRSPLGIINGYVSMLLDGTLSASDQHKALLRVAEKSDEMGQLVTEMLETARLEAVGLAMDKHHIDLLDVIDSAIRTVQPLLGAKHRIAALGSREPLPVIADAARVTTMLVNLLDNAIKYSPAGGDIEVAWQRRAGVGYINIADQGVGIGRSQQSMLFTRFGRLVTPETSHIRGTGLGLYLAREIARLHGGDITLKSQVGRGTTFTVTMPISSA
jgi:signal transduction histidine kinase